VESTFNRPDKVSRGGICLRGYGLRLRYPEVYRVAPEILSRRIRQVSGEIEVDDMKALEVALSGDSSPGEFKILLYLGLILLTVSFVIGYIISSRKSRGGYYDRGEDDE